MRRLLLFRHAKSSWASPGLKDFERPLAPRGVKAAGRMGQYMKDSGLVPDLVLCSSAARTRQTLDLTLGAMRATPETRFEDRLYSDGPETVVELLKTAPDNRASVMVVGHNPAIAECALLLAVPGAAGLRTAISSKFPTAGLAVLDFPVDEWAGVEAGTAELKSFVKPRALAQARPA